MRRTWGIVARKTTLPGMNSFYQQDLREAYRTLRRLGMNRQSARSFILSVVISGQLVHAPEVPK